MKPYIVLYKDFLLLPSGLPCAFACQAKDADHAEEQCISAKPDCEVMWVTQTESVNEALADYWGE